MNKLQETRIVLENAIISGAKRLRYIRRFETYPRLSAMLLPYTAQFYKKTKQMHINSLHRLITQYKILFGEKQHKTR